ncbi:unnamed protein product, partial [Sphagnum compactum]
MYVEYLSSLWMSFEGQQSQYAMSHFNMLNNFHSSLWMSFKGQDQYAMSLLVMCMYLLWSIKSFLSVF